MTSRTMMLRLAGPMQSWGTDSRYTTRRTGNHPSLSGVVGLLAAAAGRGREESVDDLAALRVDVRIDQPGTKFVDYHTVAVTVDGKPATEVTHRWYLADAVFVVAVHGPAALIEELASAVQNPVYTIYLGRKACTPSEPLLLGVTGEDPLDALAGEPWHGHGTAPRMVEVVTGGAQGYQVDDVPVSWDREDRRYGQRTVEHCWIPVKGDE